MENMAKTDKTVGLPLEVFLIILESMAAEKDLGGLFHIAQTCQTLAEYALPRLYEHFSEAGASRMTRGHIVNQSLWWRSVIMSTLDQQTYQPYYAFIKTLNLSNLYRRLDRMNCQQDGTELQDSFCSHPLQALKIKHGDDLDCLAIASQAGKMVTDRLHNIPIGDTSHGLPRLASLVVDGDFPLTPEMGLAIRNTCPQFQELDMSCEHWLGMVAEEPDLGSDRVLGGFIQNLAPNSLVSLKCWKHGGIRPETAQGLRHHAMSLRHLGLEGGLDAAGLGSLPLLGPLVNMATIHLKCAWVSQNAAVPHLGSPTYQSLVNWARQLLSLKQLRITYLANTTEFVKDVLQASEIRLETLSLHYNHDEDMPSTSTYEDQIDFYNEIGKQTTLRYLDINRPVDFPEAFDEADPLYQAFSNALTQLTQLRRLLITAPISYTTFAKVAKACPHLEQVHFHPHRTPGEETVDLDWLEALKGLHSLTYLEWVTETSFTSASLVAFLEALADDPLGCHEGFTLNLQSQAWSARFSRKEKMAIRSMTSHLGGEFLVFYGPRDDEPDHP